MAVNIRRYVEINSTLPSDPLAVQEFERYDEVTREEYEALLQQIEALQAQTQSLLNQAGILTAQSLALYEQIEDASNVNCIKDLSTVDRNADVTYNVVGFYANTILGGGQIIWDATKNKAEHNGGTIIAPEALDAWDGTSNNITQLLTWTGIGNGCFIRLDQTFYIEYFGCSPTITNNDVIINRMCLFPLNVIRTLAPGWYPIYQISGAINFNNRPFDLKKITIKPINSIALPPGSFLVRTGTTAMGITTSRSSSIKIDGNAGSVNGGTSNAANQANAYVAMLIYGDRTPKSEYYIDLSNCTHGVWADADCETTDITVHASYVDFLINEIDGDENRWAIFAKYCGQWFKTDGQSSGYVFFMVEQSADKGVPCVDVRGGKSYSLGGLIRAINYQPIVIDDSPTGGNGTGHVNFDDLQIIQVRNTVGLRIKNVDVVSGSVYIENYTAGGVILDDIRSCPDLTINLSDCRGGVPCTVSDLGTTLRFNSKINLNISRSTGGTPSATALQIDSSYNATFNIGKCFGNIVVASTVGGVHVDLDSDFVYSNKTITVNNPAGNFSATIGGLLPIDYVQSRVTPWAFNGLVLSSVYRGSDFVSEMIWSQTGWTTTNTLVSNSAQLSVASDLFKINALCRVLGQPVFLADLGFPVYTDGYTQTSSWKKEDGTTVISSPNTTQLKYSCSISGPVTYDLSTDRFAASRPDSDTSGQLIYFLPNGTYAVDLQNFSGATLAIRDDTTIIETVTVGTRQTHNITITTGELRINNQFYPHTTVFTVHSVTLVP